MEKILVDHGQTFDFGKTSKEYAKYRNIYPKELYDKLYSLGVGTKDSNWLDLGTGTGEIPRGLAHHGANIYAVDISKSQIDEAIILSSEYKSLPLVSVFGILTLILLSQKLNHCSDRMVCF